MSQDEANRFCRAASAVFYSIARSHALRTGKPVCMPLLLCPRGTVPVPREFSSAELREAERFLLRLGVIRFRVCKNAPDR
jgi:hypothetical protein